MNEGEIQSDAIVCEKVAPVTDDFDATILVESIYPGEDFVMREDICALCGRLAVWGPLLEQTVLVLRVNSGKRSACLCIADWDGLVDNISNSRGFLLEVFATGLHVSLKLLLVLLQLALFGNQLGCISFGLQEDIRE